VFSNNIIPIDCFADLKYSGLGPLKVGTKQDVFCPQGCHMTGGQITGSGTYTSNSRICKAAIHIGAMGVEGGIVTLTISSLTNKTLISGSSQHGISSETSVQKSGTKMFTPTSPAAPDTTRATNAKLITCQTQGKEFRYLMNGQTVDLKCPTACNVQDGAVYGIATGYADASSVCRAAIHSGIIRADGGAFVLKLFPNQQNVTGSTANGIVSQTFSSFDGRSMLFQNIPMNAAVSVSVPLFVSTPFDECPGNCSCKGVCVDGKCLCDPGFFGPDCSISLSVCVYHCSGAGLCEASQCTCVDGYSNMDCSVGPYHGVCKSN